MYPAGVAETHSAWVFFVDERAYKLKKPVKLDVLDFTSLEGRRAATRREVELNRRLAPDVYLGVADVVGPDGQVCDHLVVMRRMPEERRLSTLAQADARLDDEIDEIARVVAAFHTAAATSPEISAMGRPAAVSDKVERDLSELRGLGVDLVDETVVEEIATLARRYLAGRAPLLEARVASGCIRDGHGDLLADDIFCLEDGPRILDCIEFDDRLRYGDVLADIAFLAMDLERLGATPAAERLMASYRRFTNEHHPKTLEHYYIAFRALIRAKVACVRAGQGDPDSARQARALLALALIHLRRGRVRLVLVGGAPGTGKSTIAARLGERFGSAVIRSDEVRKDIAGMGHTARAELAIREGIYDDATTTETYETLLERARRALQAGEPVILDASWSRQEWREAAGRIADETLSDLVQLRCDAPIGVARERIERRRTAGNDVSDATVEVADEMRGRFDPWPSAVAVDTDSPLHQSLAAAVCAVDEEAGPPPS